MTILFRYVFREFLIPLTYCLVGFLGIYVIFELFDSFNRILESHPAAWDIISFFAGYVSPYLQWLIPAALLLGTIYTMWNFCRNSEVTAMRANGIGFSIIVRPILIIGIFFSIVVACINEFYAPWASGAARDFYAARFKKVPSKIFTDVVYYNQEAKRIWRVDNMDSENPNVLNQVHISFDRTDGSRKMDISCKKALYLDGMWWLDHPVYHYYDPLNNPIPNPKPQLAALTLRSFPDFEETPRDFLLMNKSWGAYTVREMVHYLKAHTNLTPKERNDRLYDIHARLASPFSCLVITLFAIPAGVATSRQSVFRGVIAAVAMFFGFYALTIACMVLTKNGFIPAIPAAWFANIVFTILGGILFYRQR